MRQPPREDIVSKDEVMNTMKEIYVRKVVRPDRMIDFQKMC